MAADTIRCFKRNILIRYSHNVEKGDLVREIIDLCSTLSARRAKIFLIGVRRLADHDPVIYTAVRYCYDSDALRYPRVTCVLVLSDLVAGQFLAKRDLPLFY